jgi:WD40 repeat protein
VWKVDFHPTSPDYVLSCAEDGDLLLWDFHSPTLQNKFVSQDKMAVHRLLHSPLYVVKFSTRIRFQSLTIPFLGP